MLDTKAEIVKCSHCRVILSKKQFDRHKCASSELQGQKKIEVVYFMDVSCNDKKMMTGLGVDGVLYTFEVVPRKPISIIMPLNRVTDDYLQRKRTDEDLTEPSFLLFIRGRGSTQEQQFLFYCCFI
jgi:hypothetical protein